MYVRSLNRLGRRDALIAGNKAATLGELGRAGVPVPSGFVILCRAFERFLDETDLGVAIAAELNTADLDKLHTIERAARRIRALLLAERLPTGLAVEIRAAFARLGARFVAVRSSATAEDSRSAAWAGQLESYLATPERDLLKNVQRCWASLFTPRAIFYRLERKAPADIAVAVVVQRMVPAEVSGICFTAHPITGDPRQMVIEAVYGLGEALARGSMTPDTYVVRKSSAEILDANVSVQSRMTSAVRAGMAVVKIPKVQRARQKLVDRKIIELARLCRRIEARFRKPQDIEWALARGKFFILQSRPITTL